MAEKPDPLAAAVNKATWGKSSEKPRRPVIPTGDPNRDIRQADAAYVADHEDRMDQIRKDYAKGGIVRPYSGGRMGGPVMNKSSSKKPGC